MIEDHYLCLNCKEIFNESERIKGVDEEGKEYNPCLKFYCPYCHNENLEKHYSLDKKIKSEKGLNELWKKDRREKILNPLILQAKLCFIALVFSITFVLTEDLFFAIMDTILIIIFLRAIKE